MRNKRLQGELLLLLITAVWGASFPLMRNALGMMPFFAYTAIRFSIASVALLIIFRKRLKEIRPKLLLRGCAVGVLLFSGMYLQVLGLKYTTASNSAFITGLNVVMVPIISALMLRKRPDMQSVVGVLLAFAGLFFLSGGLQMKFDLSDAKTLGDAITLLCAVCFALQIITIDKFAGGCDAILIGVVQVVSAAVLFNAVWMVTGIHPFYFTLGNVSILLFTGLLGTALAFVGQTWVQKYTTPTRTALIITVEPVFGALFSAVIPDLNGKTDAFTLSTIIGCALILCGMFAVELPVKSRKN